MIGAIREGGQLPDLVVWMDRHTLGAKDIWRHAASFVIVATQM
jgi:hypothetical protein